MRVGLLFALIALIALGFAGLAPATLHAGEVVLAGGDGRDDPQLLRDFRWRTGLPGAVIVRSSQLVDSGGILLLGPAPVACEGASIDSAALTAKVAEAEGAVNYVEFDRASELLAAAWQMVPCLSTPLEAETLSRLHFFRGLSAFYKEGADRSREDFRRGLLVSPFLQWDPNYTPDAHAVFEEALREALEAGEGLLELSQGLQGSEVRLNGVVLDARTRTRPLFEGTHLLQVGRGAALRTFVFELERGGVVELVQPSDLSGALGSTSTGKLARQYTAGRLQTQAKQADTDVVWVERRGELPVFDRYYPAEDRWQRVDDRRIPDRVRRARGVQAVGVGTLAAGIATVVAGSAVLIVSGQEAADLGSAIDAALIQPLDVEHGERPSAEVAARLDGLYQQYAEKRASSEAGWGIGVAGLGISIAGIVPLIVGSAQVRGRQVASDWEE